MTNTAHGASAPAIFSFESTSVRTFVDDNGEPWFLANDVCAVLGYKQPRDAVAKHCRQKGVAKRDTPTESGIQEMTFINEGNLYRLIIKSRKPQAERFEQWVMEDVLPTIRKTGAYVAAPYTQNPGDALTKEQADQLRQILSDAAKARYATDTKKQGAFLMRGWSKLKAHFKVGYRDIPQSEFAEAVSLVTRHVIEPELLDAAPAAPSEADILAAARAELSRPGQRFMTVFTPDPATGEPLITMMSVPIDAMVMSWSEVPTLLRDPGVTFAIDTPVITQIATACMDAISRKVAR
ncbi:Bro-N domain-containing protein [Aquabacterium sp.]|uniref:BRO-N domain-containing protein n=1 Tax=Aquabacterium sp. TaxID=1872578 RepID=UPI002627ED69|nr:Bro-N domain-containing protein [Aquabacterium sp.]MDD2978299.1 Bro-N domain-containing protein [Aquabacterium sp.]